MDPVTIGTAAGSLALAAVSAWKSYRADKQTRNTGNGFAGKVLGELSEIKDLAKSANTKIDHHIQSHADASLR